MTSTSLIRVGFAFVFGLAGLCALNARGHGDVWLSTDTTLNRLAVGTVEESATTYTPGERVFEAILTPDALPFSSFDFSGEEPGFRSAAGDLPASQEATLTLATLSAWNGAGLDPAVDVGFGFNLAGGFSSDASGAFHHHPLRGLTDLSPGATGVPDGVYVAALRASVAGLGDSDLFYLVMLKDALIEEESDAEALEELLEAYEEGGPAPVFGGKDFSFFEEAVEHVAASVPEPSGLLLGMCAAAGVMMVRRRRGG